MQKIFLTSFIVFLTGIQLSAQTNRWSVSGTVIDKEGKALPSATITLLDPKDSTLLTFGVSNPSGYFEIKNLRDDELLLQVSFVGFSSYSIPIQIPTGISQLVLGDIRLQEKTADLDEFTVETIAPVTIKKDTIEFNAGSFKTMPNANVEELLKRLPGFEIDADGNIKAQGETIRRVLVDGKEFFGNDPKLATKNLLAEAIEKVQVLNRKSEQSLFTGIDDGQREKTINLKLKDSHKKGFFGNINSGYGSDDRYAIRANLNKFSDKQQLSFLGMSNNTNEQGFSIDDYINFQGGLQSMANSGGGMVRITLGGQGRGQSFIPLNNGQRINGIMNSHALGTNFNKDFNKKTQMRSSYFYNQIDHRISQNTDRLNFFPEGDVNFNENSYQNNMSANHRLNLILDQKIDSLNSLRSSINGQYSLSDGLVNSVSSNRDKEGNLLNRGERSNFTQGNNYLLNTELLIKHRFSKPGKTLSANLIFGYNAGDYEGSLYAENEFFGNNPGLETIRQENLQRNTAFNYGANLSYTEPLGGRKYLELVYNFRQNFNDVNREVYDLEGENRNFNKQLSNKFNSVYTYHRPGANFSYNSGKYNLVAGLALQATRLNGELLLFDEIIRNSFENFLPSMRMNYGFSNTKNLMFNYQTSVTEPSIEQLQPVINNADPLNIYVGNPELRPAYVHSWMVNYNSFDIGKFINLFVSAFVNFTENAIVNAQSIDDRLVRTISPMNVRNSLMANTSFNLGFPIKPLNSRFNIGPNILYNKGYNMINDLEDVIRINSMGGNIRYDYNWKEYINIGLSANLNFQETAYEFSPEQNQQFLNQNFNAELGVNFLKQYSFSGNFNYLKYNSRTTDFDESIPLLNLSISRFILKNNKGEIRFSGQNLLNQNIGVSQRADVNFVEQTVTNNLGRIVMLSFTYKLNSNLNPMGNMSRPGGGTRIIRMTN